MLQCSNQLLCRADLASSNPPTQLSAKSGAPRCLDAGHWAARCEYLLCGMVARSFHVQALANHVHDCCVRTVDIENSRVVRSCTDSTRNRAVICEEPRSRLGKNSNLGKQDWSCIRFTILLEAFGQSGLVSWSLISAPLLRHSEPRCPKTSQPLPFIA